MQHVLFYPISSLFEIIACIAGYYYINSWLFHRDNKILLFYWYGYHTLGIGAYLTDLPVISFLTIYCFPLILVMVIIFHEQRLQKMYVVAQHLNSLSSTTIKSHWIEELMKFALIRLNEQKEFAVIIEQDHALASIITAQELIHADLKKNTLELLYDSFTLPKEHFLWISHSGKIISLSARWKNISFLESIHVTTATDCLLLRACPTTRRFTVMHGNKILEDLSAHHALNILNELHFSTVKKREDNNVTQTHLTSYNNPTLSE